MIIKFLAFKKKKHIFKSRVLLHFILVRIITYKQCERMLLTRMNKMKADVYTLRGECC